MQEIAIRVRLRERERLELGQYERIVGSVATVAALAAWLPTPDARLVLRGRGAEPVRVETLSYGGTFEMLVVLDQRSATVERAALVLSALIGSVSHEHVEDDVAGVAGELDRLDRAAPRGRTVAERSLRALLEGARADVLARKTTTRVRAASALVRLAEDGAEIVVERVDGALAPVAVETEVENATDDGGFVVVPEPVDGIESASADVAPVTPEAAAEVAVAVIAEAEQAKAKAGKAGKKSDKKKSSKKADKKDAAKKSDAKSDKKDGKKKADKKADKKKSKKK